MSIAKDARMLEATKPIPFAGMVPEPQPDIATAVEKANLWTVTAAPIVKAIFALEDADSEVLRGCDLRTAREARAILGKPQRELREMLVGIRDEFLADQLPPQPSADAPEAEWDARDEFADAVAVAVISVDALIRKMEREA